MSLSVACYRLPKTKSRLTCEAFAAGCGGAVFDLPCELQPGAAFFYGVTDPTRPLWSRCKKEGRDWLYCDNAYFDVARQTYFRVTRNAFQVSTLQKPDYQRFASLGLQVSPWTRGDHIVVVEQSSAFLLLCGYRGDWLDDTLKSLRRYTQRPIRIRRWDRDKVRAGVSLKEDLVGAHALVTHMSAAANEALLAGVPVFVTGKCAASPLSSGELSNINSPLYPGGRDEWAAGLAGQQWTLDEMRSGMAWRALNDHS